jgi:hypothetical protein
MIHVIVADTRTLRIFEAPSAENALREAVVYHNIAAVRHERDLVSDRPGRVINRAAGVHQTYEPRVHAREHAMQQWLRTSGTQLSELLEAHGNQCVVLVASPRMLAQLKSALPASVRRRIYAQVPLDLARAKPAELSIRLRPAIRTAIRKAVHAETGYRSVQARGTERRPAA